jgi:hypothetical protein
MCGYYDGRTFAPHTLPGEGTTNLDAAQGSEATGQLIDIGHCLARRPNMKKH